MHLKWFKGRAMPDVVSQIKRELGPEAVILHSKSLRAWGPLKSMGGRVEVLAAVDRRPEGGAPERSVITAPARERARERAVEPTRVAESPGVSVSSSGRVAPANDALGAEVAALRQLLVQFAGARLLPPALAPFYERMVTAGVEPALAQQMLAEVPPPAKGESRGALAKRVATALTAALSVAGPSSATRVALVGLPGAGKTATVAKLAARAQLAGKRAAVIDLDGSGLGASNALEGFAAIAEVPYVAALDADAVAHALDRVPAGRLTILDTPGASPHDVAGLQRLGDLVRAARAEEIHLVLPATTKTADALAAVRAFAALGATHLLFTRLDETTSQGSVLAVGVESGLPLSHVGTGRDIPGDLAPASARAVVHSILGLGVETA